MAPYSGLFSIVLSGWCDPRIKPLTITVTTDQRSAQFRGRESLRNRKQKPTIDAQRVLMSSPEFIFVAGFEIPTESTPSG